MSQNILNSVLILVWLKHWIRTILCPMSWVPSAFPLSWLVLWQKPQVPMQPSECRLLILHSLVPLASSPLIQLAKKTKSFGRERAAKRNWHFQSGPVVVSFFSHSGAKQGKSALVAHPHLVCMVASRSMHDHAENWLTTTTWATMPCDADGADDYDSNSDLTLKLIYTERFLLWRLCWITAWTF